MTLIKEHIIFKILTLFLVVTLFAPTALKLTHVFNHHEHKVCIGDDSTHIHQVDLDCDFHKFQLNTNFTVNSFAIKLFTPKEKFIEIVSQYNFLSKYQRLHFSLRGPPNLI